MKWNRFFIWLDIGLMIYFFYGRERSTKREGSGSPVVRFRNATFASRYNAAGAVTVVATLSLFVSPRPAHAWGAAAERLVANKAVDTLPPEIRAFFEANRDFLTHHVAEPLDWLEKKPLTERRNHFLYLDHYGKFPFDSLPRNYQVAVSKFTKSKLESSGVLPWQIGVFSQKLTAAMREHDWEQTRLSRRLTIHSIPRRTLTAICPGSQEWICVSDQIWWTVIRHSFPYVPPMPCF